MTVTQTTNRRTPPAAERAEGIRKAALIFLGAGLTPERIREGDPTPIVAEVADEMATVLAEAAAGGAR